MQDIKSKGATSLELIKQSKNMLANLQPPADQRQGELGARKTKKQNSPQTNQQKCAVHVCSLAHCLMMKHADGRLPRQARDKQTRVINQSKRLGRKLKAAVFSPFFFLFFACCFSS
jgi:hypothetical protein